MNAGCRSCRAVGLSQRRGLGSHVQKNEAGMYEVAGREDGRREGREVDEVRVLAETMAKFGKLTAFFVAVSLVSLLFSSTEPGFGRNTSSMLLLTPDRELFLLGNDRGHLAA